MPVGKYNTKKYDKKRKNWKLNKNKMTKTIRIIFLKLNKIKKIKKHPQKWGENKS